MKTSTLHLMRLLLTVVVVGGQAAVADDAIHLYCISDRSPMEAAATFLAPGTSFLEWCDGCPGAPTRQPVAKVVRTVAVKQVTKGVWGLVVNGHRVDVRHTFAKLVDGTYRRLAPLGGCPAYSGTDEEIMTTPEYLLNALPEALPPGAGGDPCDVSAPLMERSGYGGFRKVSVPRAMVGTQFSEAGFGQVSAWVNERSHVGLVYEYTLEAPTAEEAFAAQREARKQDPAQFHSLRRLDGGYEVERLCESGDPGDVCFKKFLVAPETDMRVSHHLTFRVPGARAKACAEQAHRVLDAFVVPSP